MIQTKKYNLFFKKTKKINKMKLRKKIQEESMNLKLNQN